MRRLTEPAIRSARLRITGRVQGVGYRAWAIDTAARLGLRGWVRNRADGSVEVLAIGEDECGRGDDRGVSRGPFAARVGEIAVDEAEDDGSDGFRPRPTV